jgi:hypothetical protein
MKGKGKKKREGRGGEENGGGRARRTPVTFAKDLRLWGEGRGVREGALLLLFL